MGLLKLIDNVDDSKAEIFKFTTSPNPFFDEVNIEFNLPSSNKVRLEVYDLSGSHISTLFDGRLDADAHNYTLEGKTLSSGEYSVILTIGNERLVRKIVRVK